MKYINKTSEFQELIPNRFFCQSPSLLSFTNGTAISIVICAIIRASFLSSTLKLLSSLMKAAISKLLQGKRSPNL